MSPCLKAATHRPHACMHHTPRLLDRRTMSVKVQSLVYSLLSPNTDIQTRYTHFYRTCAGLVDKSMQTECASMSLWWGHGEGGLFLLFANGCTLSDLMQVAHAPLCCFLQPLRQARLQLLCMLHMPHIKHFSCLPFCAHVCTVRSWPATSQHMQQMTPPQQLVRSVCTDNLTVTLDYPQTTCTPSFLCHRDESRTPGPRQSVTPTLMPALSQRV